jgi:hypothetical protein
MYICHFRHFSKLKKIKEKIILKNHDLFLRTSGETANLCIKTLLMFLINAVAVAGLDNLNI